MKLVSGIIFSFYSKTWYKQVYQANVKRCLLYLLVMLAIVWVLFSIRFAINLNTSLDATAQAIAKQLPVMTLHQGELTTKEPGTYKIYYPGSKNIAAIIQTDKPLANFANEPALAWVGKDRILYRKSSTSVGVWTYPPTTSMTITAKNFPQLAKSYTHSFLPVLAVIFYIVGFIIVFPVTLVLCWLMAPFVKSIAKSLEVNLKISKARNLAIAAVTPFWVLLSLLYLFNILSALVIFLLLIVLVSYPVYATIACRELAQKSKKENKK